MELQDEILRYWFGAEEKSSDIAAQKSSLWWGKSEKNDREVTEKFGSVLNGVKRGPSLLSRDTPRGRLALIILLDQMSRMIYRGTAESYSQDLQALGLSLDGIFRGLDQELRSLEKVFFYLPLEHSESVDVQRMSVECFKRLADSVDEDERPLFEEYVRYAEQHRDIVDRFGRFPHRNVVLGRRSTREEEEFLKQPNSSF